MGNYPSLSSPVYPQFFLLLSLSMVRDYPSLTVNEEVCRLVIVAKVTYPNATRPTIEYCDSIVRDAIETAKLLSYLSLRSLEKNMQTYHG